MGPAFTGHFRITADTPRGLVPLGPNVPISAVMGGSTAGGSVAQGAAAAESDGIVAGNEKLHPARGPLPLLPVGRSIYEPHGEPHRADASATTTSFFCTTCAVDCSKLRYKSLKDPRIIVCPLCFQEGRFSSSMFSGDFVKFTDSPNTSAMSDPTAASPWTEQEELCLLEGIELYADNWDRVAAHVSAGGAGTERTKQECILHFLQLPLRIPFWGLRGRRLARPRRLRRTWVRCSMHASRWLPRRAPVLTLAALLASVVPADVAKLQPMLL